MVNEQILRKLEHQRDLLFEKLNNTSISGLYEEQYTEIKSGRVFVFNNGENQMLDDLKKLSKDKSLDPVLKKKLQQYQKLDNKALTTYFEKEFRSVFKDFENSGKQDQIQAVFIEYDYYYDFTSCISCYGQQEYPLVEEPRYISEEYDFNKQILFLDNGINFEPAWLNCEELENLDYLDVEYDLQKLFKLHSRTLLHKALERMSTGGDLDFIECRPFTFYINEHDQEEMTLYRIN